MDTELSSMIHEIISTGRQKGMTQKDIARITQYDPVSISRAKSADDIKYSTLKAWAKSVGLRLTLVPDSTLAEKVRKGELFND